MSVPPNFTCLKSIQHERFTRKEDGFRIWYLSLSLSGKIAVSGYDKDERTFIDLYFGITTDYQEHLKPFYSKEFEKYSVYLGRYVSFLQEEYKIVTCIGDRIEIFDTTNGSKVLRCHNMENFNVRCLAVSGVEIFVGFRQTNNVIVFDSFLNETRRITLSGIGNEDYPDDMVVSKDTLFVCSYTKRALSFQTANGKLLTVFPNITENNSKAYSITVGEKLGLVCVVWDAARIIFYPYNEYKPFSIVDVGSGVSRIRFSDDNKKIVMANHNTGQIKIFDLQQFFSFESMKRTLATLTSDNEFAWFKHYFGVTEEEMDGRKIEQNDISTSVNEKKQVNQEQVKKIEGFLSVIERRGKLFPWNMDKLKTAIASLGDENRTSILKRPFEGYELYGMNIKDLVAGMTSKGNAWERERCQLYTKLGEATKSLKEQEQTFNDLQAELEEVKNVSEQNLQLKEATKEKDSLANRTSESAKEIETLTENVYHTKETDRKRKDCNEKMEALREEVKKAKKSSHKERAEYVKEKESLTKELKKARQSLDKYRADSTKQIKALKQKQQLAEQSLNVYKRKYSERSTPSKPSLGNYKKESAKEIKALREKLKQTKSLLQRCKLESIGEKNILKRELEECRRTVSKSENKFNKDLSKAHRENKILLEKLNQNTKLSLNKTDKLLRELAQVRCKLKQSQLEHAMESQALKETRKAFSELQKIAGNEEKTKETKLSLIDSNMADLAARYGRLCVSVAEQLTLDHVMKLAVLYDVSPSQCDLLRRVSSTETPGIRLFDILKERSIISMWNVTNLENGLTILDLTSINRTLIKHYKESLGKDQHKEHKILELKALNDEAGAGEMSQDEHNEVNFKNPATSMTQQSKKDGGSKASHLGGTSRQSLSLEKSIGQEGGALQVDDVYVTIPPGALKKNHRIALSVINESLLLPKQFDEARMTPFIQLEPLGLKFRKPIRLSIPLYSLTSTPPDVFIYTGKRSHYADQHLDITWVEERRLTRKDMDESLEIDIECLSYLYASFERQTHSPSPHSMRAVPFLDAIRKVDDDIVLTIAFCADSDSEYYGLLSDYREKLPLHANYSTFHLLRYQQSMPDDERFLHVTVSCSSNNYIPDVEPKIKKIDVNHLLADKKVTYQCRLKKNHEEEEQDVVEVTVLLSQAHCEQTELTLKAKIKNLIISQKIEDLFNDPHTSGTLSNGAAFLAKEQYIDERGGDMFLPEANVKLVIPGGALPRDNIIGVTVMTSAQVNFPWEETSPRLTPVVKCGQGDLSLNKPITLTIPHCAADTRDVTSVDIYFGFSSEGKHVRWKKFEGQKIKSFLKKDRFEIQIQQFCTIYPIFSIKKSRKPFTKYMRVVSFISRVAKSTDNLNVTLWVYNDDETEHSLLVSEEINVRGKILLCDFKKFTVNASEGVIDVCIDSTSDKLIPLSRESKERLSSIELLRTSRKNVEYKFQNNTGVQDITFNLEVRRKDNDFRCVMKTSLTKLLTKRRVTAEAFYSQQQTDEEKASMGISFNNLLTGLSETLQVKSCLDLARMFELPMHFRNGLKESIQPGEDLFKQLVHDRVITASNVLALDVALRKLGKEGLANQVKTYRKRNNNAFPTVVEAMPI